MRRLIFLGAALAAVSGCARSHPAERRAPVEDVDDPAARAAILAPALDGYQAVFILTWDGHRIGDASERFTASPAAAGGYRFERSERVQVRRQGAVSSSVTEIRVDLDDALVPRHVWVERRAGQVLVHGEAVRLVDDAWRVSYDGTPDRLFDGAAMPSTLVPLLVAASGVASGRGFDAPVMVEGAGLAVAHLAVDVSGDRRTARARLSTAVGELRAQATLDDRGLILSAGEGAAVASRRATADEVAAPFDPPDLVEGSAVAVAGLAADPHWPGALHLLVHGVRAAPPALDDLPAQQATLLDGGDWDVRVSAAAPAGEDGLAVVRERTRHVSRLLEDDSAVAARGLSEALAARRGDCTAHALVLQSLLRERGLDARLVTGFVLDDGALRRHRWVTVRVGHTWVPVDPMFDEVPASPAHLALAVHDSSIDEMAFIDEVAFAGWEGATARLLP